MKKYTFTFTGWTVELAYLVGVYLSDGSISNGINGKRFFSHNCIDKEFVLKTKSALKKVLQHNIQYGEYDYNGKENVSLGFKKRKIHLYRVIAYNREFCDWLENITNGKTIVPKLEQLYMIHLLSAFLDGDGFISSFFQKNPVITKSPYVCYCSGVSGKNGPLIDNIKKSLQDLGVKICNKKHQGHRDVITYKLNLKSLAESGICFSINRKFFKFCEYVNSIIPSTTIRRVSEYK
jgi:hypothetical protein